MPRAQKTALLDQRVAEVGWESFEHMLRSELPAAKLAELTGAHRHVVTRRRQKLGLGTTPEQG